MLNSLVPGRCGSDFMCVVFHGICMIEIYNILCEITLKGLPWDLTMLTDDEPTPMPYGYKASPTLLSGNGLVPPGTNIFSLTNLYGKNNAWAHISYY